MKDKPDHESRPHRTVRPDLEIVHGIVSAGQLVGKSGELRLIFKMVKVWLSLVEFKRVKVPDPRENQPPPYDFVAANMYLSTV